MISRSGSLPANISTDKKSKVLHICSVNEDMVLRVATVNGPSRQKKKGNGPIRDTCPTALANLSPES